MRSTEIVDIDLDPREERRRRRRAWLRIGLPVGTVLLIVAAIIGITFYSYLSNRRDALALSREVLRALDERIVTQLQSYLTPAVRVQPDPLGASDGAVDEAHRSLAERLSTEVLRNVPQLAIISFGNQNGDFLMLRREASGAIDTKTIENTASGRRVTWIRRIPRAGPSPSRKTGGHLRSAQPSLVQGGAARRRRPLDRCVRPFTDRKPG